MRIGFGYDSHRLVEGRPLILGGVCVPHEKGLLGHSDADVLCHAVIDALLGAAHLGNIGRLFPDTDSSDKDVSSTRLLKKAAGLVESAGFKISNIDTTLVLERPKVSQFVRAMEYSIADACAISPELVSVKPKTNEGMGNVGRGEGAAAYAVCILLAMQK